MREEASLNIGQEQRGGALAESARSVGVEGSARCIACGGSRWAFAREGFDLYRPSAGVFRLERCLECSHVMQIPAPTAEQLSEAYAVGYAAFRPAWKQPGWPVWKILRVITTWRRMKRLERYGKGKNLLEIGSGAGDFLRTAQRAGWEVSGVEYSEKCADLLRAETGIDMKAGELKPGLWDAATFDIVALWNVVEHLHDPVGTLSLAAYYLRPGGAAFIQVPTCDCVEMGRGFGPQWELLDLPRHLNFFNRESLAAVCRHAGMELIKFRTSAVDIAWCYLASIRNRAGSKSKFGKKSSFGWGVICVLLLLPWMAFRAWRGRGTEAFAIAVKR